MNSRKIFRIYFLLLFLFFHAFNSSFLMKSWFLILEFHIVLEHFSFSSSCSTYVISIFKCPLYLERSRLFSSANFAFYSLHSWINSTHGEFFFYPTNDPTCHYVLYPSDSPGALIVFETFHGDNYTSWSSSISMALSVKNNHSSLMVLYHFQHFLILYTIVRFVLMN